MSLVGVGQLLGLACKRMHAWATGRKHYTIEYLKLCKRHCKNYEELSKYKQRKNCLPQLKYKCT